MKSVLIDPNNTSPYFSLSGFKYTEKILYYTNFFFIILSKSGRVSAADILGDPKPRIPEKGTPMKASPTSL